ncbi:DUF5655 domain-containing protein [Hoeflea poritis]|uniref:DUF5655 domain-containing protein n=1 Tax=Hoeflea poritis TaxID=2993659 RepID=A0ABT4VNG0_9HYPH|nr:DUF5655 domain-containing protein [Hoeflea poritis]MDA4846144.1 DUF5655 domain-containing protein [Hoeflea poritis]
MSDQIRKFFCNICSGHTNHFVQREYTKTSDNGYWTKNELLIIECCGCEHSALVKRTLTEDDIEYFEDPTTGEQDSEGHWNETIYPPVTYRDLPNWFDDLPDPTLQEILRETYKSLQTESHYLATFGSRTLLDRLIVLTVGDKGNFQSGLKALRESGKISQHEHEIIKPVVQAGNAAAHRGWAPSKEQLTTILDTVEGLIHRLLVLPKLAEELEEAVPARDGEAKRKSVRRIPTTLEKIEAAPTNLRELYDALDVKLRSLGNDIKINPQKHYIAYRRRRNFASVQIYNQKQLLRVYLNVEPDTVILAEGFTRDVRQIGHFGTGDLEVTIESMADLERAEMLFEDSYFAS